MDAPSLHIAMFSHFAMGHLTPYLHLSNKLAKKGHRISFLIPKRTQAKLHHFNHYPHLINFVPITVPHVDGLPHGAETTNDVPAHLLPLILTAMDHTKHDIETLLLELKPNFVFFDFAHWIPTLTRRLGIKSMHYMIISPVAVAYDISPARQVQGGNLTEHELMQPPQGFPDPSIKLNIHEARANVAIRTKESGGGVSIVERLATASSLSDAIGFKGCREIDGPFVDYLAQFGKCVLLSGPVIPNPSASSLEEKWALWLKGFKAGSVIYCTLGSEFILQLNQFQELLLGLELSGMPFFAALKPPTGFDSVEAALPEGFKERIQGRGNVYGGWVQQQLILEHPSVGCYICHCGVGSLLEGLVNQCQLVFLPCIADQIFNARLMANSLKVGVEVEKGEEDGLFTKESVCKAVTTVMDNDNETGREVRANHAKLREILLKKDFETAYIDNFCKNLQDLCK